MGLLGRLAKTVLSNIGESLMEADDDVTYEEEDEERRGPYWDPYLEHFGMPPEEDCGTVCRYGHDPWDKDDDEYH